MLTSLLYRVTVHGAGSLNPAVNPTLAFVSNFPPCLQSAAIPEPGTSGRADEDLLPLLPHTGTIGGMTTFYFTFVYSQPYVPLIPSGGIKADPYFPTTQSACNAALFTYRQDIHDFVDTSRGLERGGCADPRDPGTAAVVCRQSSRAVAS